MITKKIGWFFVFLTFSITGYAQTKVVVVPLGDDEPSSKSVFVTKERFNGNLGGPEGADEKCQAEADAEGSLVKNKEFKAWVTSTSVNDYSAGVRVFSRSSLPYQLVGGVQIASNFSGLVDGSIDAPINRHADGSQLIVGPSSLNEVWTGVAADGDFRTLDNTCRNWQSSSIDRFGFRGDSRESDNEKWTDSRRLRCDGRVRLYCFEQ